MALYSVTIRGENFCLKLNGEPARLGFYTTRFVEAGSVREAEYAAIDLLRADDKLQDVLNDKDDPPMMFVEEIEEIETEEGEIPTQHGFAFYADEADPTS